MAGPETTACDVTEPLTAEKQVTLMRSEGIRFELMSEPEAIAFLRERNYYAKIHAFESCFSRYGAGRPDRSGQFINLDFAYLAELTRLDHLLRETVLSMSLDVEHYMKVAISRSVMDAKADPKDVIRAFLDADRKRKEELVSTKLDVAKAASESARVQSFAHALASGDPSLASSAAASLLHLSSRLLDGVDPEHLERSLAQGSGSSYSRELASAIIDGKPLTVGDYLELATFGGITALYKHWFYDTLGSTDPTAKAVKQLLFPTRTLRNASAHNGNVLDTLGKRLAKPIGAIATIAKKGYEVNAGLVDLTKRFPIVHDLTALLRCHDLLVAGSDSRADAARNLSAVAAKFSAHIDYFAKQAELANGMLALADLMASASDRLFRRGHPALPGLYNHR